jgi:enoyl-CoA hydratase
VTGVSTDYQDSICTIKLCNGEKRNPLSREAQDGILASLEDARRCRAKVVIIKGDGPAFCSGYNLDPSSRTAYIESPDILTDLAGLRRSAEFLLQVRRYPMPILAQVHGHCLAGGTDLMLATDIAIASKSARIGVPNVRSLGISLLSTLWPIYIGPMRSKLLFFTGDWISGEQAEKWGLVALSIAEQELDAAVTKIAQRISLLPKDLLETMKLAGNRAFETIGVDQLVAAALEIDVIAHFSPSVKDFWQEVKHNGLTPSLRKRDEPFREGNLSALLEQWKSTN